VSGDLQQSAHITAHQQRACVNIAMFCIARFNCAHARLHDIRASTGEIQLAVVCVTSFPHSRPRNLKTSNVVSGLSALTETVPALAVSPF
jgi:hypothetical protein